MAFTMHSHSGQFCPGHAQDQLEDIIKHAISIGYKTMGLTEHMPRTELADLYPEEVGGLAKSRNTVLSSQVSQSLTTARSSSPTRTPRSRSYGRGTRPTSPKRDGCRPSTRRRSIC